MPTLNFLRSHSLNEMKKLSSRLNDMINAACDERSRLIDVDSFDDFQNAKLSSVSEPHFYYFFRFLEKGISIIARHKSNSDLVYSIYCENYKPKHYVAGVRVPSFDFASFSYGEFKTLDEAKIFFKNFILQILMDEFDFQIQELLDIF